MRINLKILGFILYICDPRPSHAQPLKTLDAAPSLVLYPTVIIPEQHPLTWDEDLYNAVPDGFYYLFGDERPISNAESVTKAANLPICGQILEPGYAVYVLHYPGYLNDLSSFCASGLCPSLSPVHHNVPYVPWPTQLTLTQISKCNPYQDPSCNTCGSDTAMYIARLSITHPQIDRPGDPLGLFGPLNNEKLIFDSDCLLIPREDCGVRQCQNGQYASDYLNLDSEGYVTSKVRCLPCAPGTWLTCPEDAGCTYNIPASRGDPFIGGTSVYSPTGQTPVGGCFSCETAGNGKCHYSKTQYGSCINFGAADPLPWYCPGGVLAPAQCGKEYAGSDANHTMCVCKPGSFHDGANGCSPCPAGFECSTGAIQECPDNTYQDSTGQTVCYRCTTDGTSTGAPLASCPPNQVLRRCTGRYKAEPPLCVACNMCVRDYVSSPAGRVDCY